VLKDPEQLQTACVVELMLALQEKSPDYDSYCMLAEAYMTLQEPEKAATAYEVCGSLQHLVNLLQSHSSRFIAASNILSFWLCLQAVCHCPQAKPACSLCIMHCIHGMHALAAPHKALPASKPWHVYYIALTLCLCVAVCFGPEAQRRQPGSAGCQGIRGCTRLQQGH
jgi:hypothetical protein